MGFFFGFSAIHKIMVLLTINGILALIKYRNFYFLSIAHVIILISPYPLKKTWEKIKCLSNPANYNYSSHSNCLICFLPLHPPIQDGGWLKRIAMVIHNSVTEKRESSEPHGVIWILTESLLQRRQTEILPELVTAEIQMGMPCHLRLYASTHCRNSCS